MKRYILPAILLALSGLASGVADIASTPAKFNKSVFRQWNPTFEYGEYIGHKDETWVNKYKQGTLDVKFFGSKTFLVWTTDLWHGARMAMLLLLSIAAMSLPCASKWFEYAIKYALIVLAYSSGWHIANLALG